MMVLAKRMKIAMVARKINQAELVGITGISKGAISSYLSGKYEPKKNSLHAISKALNVGEYWLMGRIGSDEIPMGREERVSKKAADTIGFYTSNAKEMYNNLLNCEDSRKKDVLDKLSRVPSGRLDDLLVVLDILSSDNGE